MQHRLSYAARMIRWQNVSWIPVGHLAKLMQQLSRTGLASSQHGLHGSFTISCDPAQITLVDAIDVVSPFRRTHACMHVR